MQSSSTPFDAHPNLNMNALDQHPRAVEVKRVLAEQQDRKEAKRAKLKEKKKENRKKQKQLLKDYLAAKQEGGAEVEVTKRQPPPQDSDDEPDDIPLHEREMTDTDMAALGIDRIKRDIAISRLDAARAALKRQLYEDFDLIVHIDGKEIWLNPLDMGTRKKHKFNAVKKERMQGLRDVYVEEMGKLATGDDVPKAGEVDAATGWTATVNEWTEKNEAIRKGE